MSKLIVCSDRLLLRNSRQLSYNSNLIREYIEKGNRFVLTTGKPFLFLYDDMDDGIPFIDSPYPLRKGRPDYTDLICLGGVYLYDGSDRMVHSHSINPEVVEYFENVSENNGNVEVRFETPFEGYRGKSNNVGDILLTPRRSMDYREAKYMVNRMMKQVKRIDPNVRLYRSSNDVYCSVRASYEVKHKDSTVDNQIEYIMNKHGIESHNVFDLRNSKTRELNKVFKKIMK